jgi:hypothetical protein
MIGSIEKGDGISLASVRRLYRAQAICRERSAETKKDGQLSVLIIQQSVAED